MQTGVTTVETVGSYPSFTFSFRLLPHPAPPPSLL